MYAAYYKTKNLVYLIKLVIPAGRVPTSKNCDSCLPNENQYRNTGNDGIHMIEAMVLPKN